MVGSSVLVYGFQVIVSLLEHDVKRYCHLLISNPWKDYQDLLCYGYCYSFQENYEILCSNAFQNKWRDSKNMCSSLIWLWVPSDSRSLLQIAGGKKWLLNVNFHQSSNITISGISYRFWKSIRFSNTVNNKLVMKNSKIIKPKTKLESVNQLLLTIYFHGILNNFI